MGASMNVTEVLGRYRIGERIGSGGTAHVYRAEVEGAAGFAKTVVVKCLRPHVADEPTLGEALAREAKLAQRLHHGNIVQVLDFGVHDDRPYVVMEHVDGCSLHELQRDLLRRGERVGLPEALFVVEELAAALRYVHALVDDDGVPLRLVHRDVKPRNVLISREGVVKLTDFGIAKIADDGEHTLPGVIKGTPAYLAPEQALGRSVDARTDVFALGLVLRELVLEDDATAAPPPDPRVDEALRRLCERATAEAPEDRFADVQAMLRALQRWRATRALEADPGRLATWVRRARRQAPVAVPVSLDAALLGVSDGGATMKEPPRPVVASDRPRRHGWLALGLALGLAAAAWASTDGPPTCALQASPAVPTAPSDSTPARLDPDRQPSRASSPEPEPSPSREATPPVDAEPVEPPTIPSAAPADPSPRRAPPPRPAVEPGRLQVNVLPWAEVTVDGRALGRVPIDVELPPGRHRVRLSNPQLGERTTTIELRAGRLHKISQW